MSIDQTIAEITDGMRANRNIQNPERFVKSWIQSRIERGEPLETGLLYAISELPKTWFLRERITPRGMVSFVATLAAQYTPQSVLDPICGLGLLLRGVSTMTNALWVEGIEYEEDRFNIARALVGPSATVVHGNVLNGAEPTRNEYDLIVANPPWDLFPFEVNGVPGLDSAYRGSYSFALAVWASSRLSISGTAMMFVPSTFLASRFGSEAISAIHGNGCRIRSIFDIPAGVHSRTRIGGLLVIIDHGEQEEVFVGQYLDDPGHQNELVENERLRRRSERPALGRLCELKNFSGFEGLVIRERIDRLARSTGWPRHRAGSVFIGVERLRSGKLSPQARTNSLTLRRIGKPAAVLDASELSPSAMSEGVRLVIDPTVADPRFLVEWFNASPIGQAVLEMSRRGTIPRIDIDALMKLEFPLPTLDEQHTLMRGIEHLNRIRAEVAEADAALWSFSDEPNMVAKRIAGINREDLYLDWIDSLPFPLASILWRHHAGEGSARDLIGVLLHFFEAVSAFVATVQLSAFMADDTLWREVAPRLHKSLRVQNLSLERATFGCWKLIAEFLSGRFRKIILNNESKATLERIYGTNNAVSLHLCSQGELLSILQRANSLRNATSGHGGEMGPDEANGVHEELKDLVQRVRGVFGRSWLDYELIQPLDGRYQRGIHHCRVQRLMGTRSAPFEIVQRESTQLLESDQLYLFDRVSRQGLLLQPFIRVVRSPKKQLTGCYFYNRRERSEIRFVSYHLAEESQITGAFVEVEDALSRFAAVGQMKT